MSEKITLHGMQFDRHPTPTRGSSSELSRYARLAVALAAARRLCGSEDRALYLSLTRAHAEVLDQVRRRRPVAPTEVLDLPWDRALSEPSSCAGGRCPGSV